MRHRPQDIPPTAPKERLTGTRERQRVDEQLRVAEHLKKSAEVAGIVTENIDNPLWTHVIRPQLESAMEQFVHAVWDPSLGPEDFKRMQCGALMAQQTRDDLIGLVGKKPELLAKAKKIYDAIPEDEIMRHAASQAGDN